MKRTLTEAKVLKKLDIPDFRHMTKDKIVKFATMLPYMDPEVAKKALEQFPDFKELAGDMVTQYKSIVEKAFEENRISQQSFYYACNSILESLRKNLEADDITFDERIRIEDKMIEVAKMIGEKDTETKQLLKSIVGIFSGCIVIICGTAAAILGSNSQASMDDEIDAI